MQIIIQSLLIFFDFDNWITIIIIRGQTELLFFCRGVIFSALAQLVIN